MTCRKIGLLALPIQIFSIKVGVGARSENKVRGALPARNYGLFCSATIIVAIR